MLRLAGPVDATGFSPGAVSGTAGKTWNSWGVSLLRLLSDAYGVPETQIVVPAPTTSDRYDVALAAPNLTETERIALLRRTLEGAFHLKLHRESRETDVYVLQRRAGIQPNLHVATSRASSHWGKDGDVTAVSVPLSFVIKTAERTVRKTIVDETDLTDRFDFNLKWDPSEPQSIVQAIRTQLGLELSPSRRRLDYLVVDSAIQPQWW